MPAAQSLADRFPTALVTGASSGIGRSLALQLVSSGVRVYGTTRFPDAPALPSGIRWIRLDAASRDGIDAFLRHQEDLLGSVALLVNSAGAGSFGDLEKLDSGHVEEQVNLLLEAPVKLTRAVLPGMRRCGSGAIVNVSSLAAVFPMPFMSLYSGTKAGLSGFTRSLMLTEAESGVIFIDFQPGDYRTAFNERMNRIEGMGEEERRAWERIEAHLKHAPGPERAARDVLKAIFRGKSAVVRSGGLFQRTIAPLGYRLLPWRLLKGAIQRYYTLRSG